MLKIIFYLKLRMRLKEVLWGYAMVTTPAKGGAMGYAMAAVPRSIDRCTALCYGPASLAGDEWAGRVTFYRHAYCACANAQVQRSIEHDCRGRGLLSRLYYACS